MRLADSRSGFTVIELALAIVLMAVVVGNVYTLLRDCTSAFGARASVTEIEGHAQRTLDRVALALVGASRSTLYVAVEPPLSASAINYETNLGVQNGELVWSDPQRIAQTEDRGRQVTWFENPDRATERRVSWSNLVTALHEGESLNGLDDNDNGLVDEKGLSFSVEGSSVLIRLTVEKPTAKGRTLVRTLETRVTCRN